MRYLIIIITLIATQACASTSIITGNDKFLTEEQIKSAQCLSGQNIDQALSRLIKTKNLQDRGWWVFTEDGGYTVERTVSVSKIMDIRYRWRVDNAGVMQPANERTNSLCLS